MVLLLTSLALAHQPWMAAEGQYASPEVAFPMEDPGLSIVVYDQLSCEFPQLWLRFEAQADEELWAQLGMPYLDRQVGWRPSMAVLAPGLPAPTADLPFDVPEGLGVQLLDSGSVSAPEQFYEPFSGTTSWVLRAEWVAPEAGEGWIVAWDPAGLTGKLWLAPGTREEFNEEDFARIADLIDDIRAFHELDGAPAGELVACVAEGGGEEAGDAGEDEVGEMAGGEGGGCSSGGAGASGLLGALGLLVVGGRRRRG